MIAFVGSTYILVGVLFLIVPLIYLELGRPKDLINAFLNLLIGLILIIKSRVINETYLIALILLTLLAFLYLAELFFSRWNQLTDKEKKKLINFLEFKKNLLKVSEAMNHGLSKFIKPLNFFNFDINKQKISPKKWVRNDKNDNINI